MRIMKYKVCSKEFGEVYHVACAAWLDSSVEVHCYKYKKAQCFLNNFVLPDGREAFNSWSDKRLDHLATTSHVISKRFFYGCMKAIVDEIELRAKQESWVLPADFDKLNGIDKKKILIWFRNKKDHASHRNSTKELIVQIQDLCKENNSAAVLLSSVKDELLNGINDIIRVNDYWDHEFYNKNSIAKQLWTINQLFENHNVLASVGMMSGAMDGPAMFYGNKTIFIARHKDATPRMQRITASIPNLIWLQAEFTDKFKALSEHDKEKLGNMIWST